MLLQVGRSNVGRELVASLGAASAIRDPCDRPGAWHAKIYA